MSKSEVKELIIMLIFSILNAIIAFAITGLFGITNTVIIKSFSLIYGDITWEVIIFMSLMFIEALIYDGFYSDKHYFSKSYIH